MAFVWSGAPAPLHVDNGADFRSRAFVGACRNEGIRTLWRLPGTPHYGGHIERLIGTVMGRVHLLSGSTGSNLAERGDADPAKVCYYGVTEAGLIAWLGLGATIREHTNLGGRSYFGAAPGLPRAR